MISDGCVEQSNEFEVEENINENLKRRLDAILLMQVQGIWLAANFHCEAAMYKPLVVFLYLCPLLTTWSTRAPVWRWCHTFTLCSLILYSWLVSPW